MGFVWSYEDEFGQPLQCCPQCRSNLTEDGSILVELSVCGTNPTFTSCLDTDGCLVDDDYSSIWKGFHSQTLCANCHQAFVDDGRCREVRRL